MSRDWGIRKLIWYTYRTDFVRAVAVTNYFSIRPRNFIVRDKINCAVKKELKSLGRHGRRENSDAEENANFKQRRSHGTNQKKNKERKRYSPKRTLFCVNNFRYHRVYIRSLSNLGKYIIFITQAKDLFSLSSRRTTQRCAQASRAILRALLPEIFSTLRSIN